MCLALAALHGTSVFTICKANVVGVYNVEKDSFVGGKETQQQEVNGKKDAAFKPWGPRKLLLHRFEKAVGGGRVGWP